MSIKESENAVDLARFPFPEHFLSRLCQGTRFPYWAKCLSAGLALYAIGGVCATVSRAFDYFLDVSFLSVFLVLGATLAFLTHTTKGVDDALNHCNNRLGPQHRTKDRARFREFVNWVKAWAPVNESIFGRPAFWYYLETLGGGLLGLLLGFYWSRNSGVWWGTPQFGLSSVFFVASCMIIGYAAGAAVFVSIGVVKVLHTFGKKFISADRILTLNPDRMGGLKPLGQLLLNLNMTLAVPSTVAFVYLAVYPELMGFLYTWSLIVLYTVLLLIVFIVPILPVHSSMIAAKEAGLEKVNKLFLELNAALAGKRPPYGHEIMDALDNVYVLYEKTSKMSSWPLDLDIAFKFTLTSFYPIVGSLIVAYPTHLMGM